MHEYRIRVTKRSEEDFKRYYPEVRYDFDKSRWQNTQSPIEMKWYKDLDECKEHINGFIEHSENYESYIVEIVDYSKQ